MRVPRTANILIRLLCLGLLCTAALPLCADEPDGAKQRILTLAISLDDAESASLQAVITDAMEVELEIAGFRPISLDPGSSPPAAASPEDVQWSSLYEAGKAVDADLLLAALFSRTFEGSANVDIELQLHDPVAGEQRHALKTRGKVDLAFDQVVAVAVREIIGKAGITAVRPAGRTEEETGAAEAEAAADAPETDAGSPATPPPERTASKPRIEAAEPQLPPTQPEPREPAALRRLEMAGGFSPFLTVGEASGYFRLGYLPSVAVNLRFPTTSGYVALGVYAGCHLFRAEGIVASSDSLLIPVGPDFRIAPITGSRLSLYLRLSAGPAVLILDPNDLGALSKVIAYVLGGIGLNIEMSPFFGLTVDSSFSIYYEKSLPIMGYTPSLYVYLRL